MPEQTLLHCLGIASLVLALAASGVAWRHRRRARLQARRIAAMEDVQREARALQEAVMGVGAGLMGVEDAPSEPLEVLRAMAESLKRARAERDESGKESLALKRTVAQARGRERGHEARIAELERVITESDEGSLRSRIEETGKDRDRYRSRVEELERLMGRGDSSVSRLLSMQRQSELMKDQLAASRRLVQVLEQQIRHLERGGTARQGPPVSRLMAHELPRGAFESVSDLLDDELGEPASEDAESREEAE